MTNSIIGTTGLINGFKMTGLGLLPDEWRVVKFEEAIKKKRINVGKVKKQKYKKLGKYPIVDQGQKYIVGYWDIEDDLYKGKLPVIIFGDHTRIFKFVNFPFVCGADGTKVIMPNTLLYDSLFLYFSFKTLTLPSRGYNRHYSLLKEKLNPLPPLPEQKKIAGVLSVVQEAKEKTEEVIKSAKELKKSLMKHLFSYGPVSIEEANKMKLKETKAGFIPEEWGDVNLEDVCSMRKETIDPKNVNNMHYIGLEHIVPEDLKIRNWGNSSNIKSTKNVFYEGDILYGKLRPYLNKVAVPEKNGICSTDIMVFEIENRKINLYYLANYLHSQPFLKYATMTMTGVNHPRTSWAKLRNYRIPLPSQKTQQEITEAFSSIDKKIDVEENKKKALEELFKTLLNNLMTGKIRVHNLDIKV